MTPEQPYVGITPIPADEFPFELDDSMLPLRMMVRILARELHSATLGHPGSRYQDIHKNMQDPRPGDLVFEESTSYRNTLDSTLGGFGVLLTKRVEWDMTDEEYAIQCGLRDWEDLKAGCSVSTPEEHARDRMTDTAWYVQYGPDPGSIYRWVDARCIALPINVADLMEAKKRWP